MNRLLLYIHTLRYLKPSQLFYLGLRRVCPAKHPQAVKHLPKLRSGTLFHEGLHSGRSWKGDDAVEFLNQSRSFPGGQIDWVCASMPKLWRYNLHYFDCLQDPSLNEKFKRNLIDDWIARVRPGAEDAWEPYPVSLRIVNWIKFFLSCSVQGSAEWTTSLYRQASWLERNLEHHLLANHLLKNGVAMVFAGLYFDGADADRWLKTGMKILEHEVDEQFLQDGGHFERSPMYHSICVVDYLDVINLLKTSQDHAYASAIERFAARMRGAVDFLQAIAHPDGEIPLFNDSATGIAPTPQRIADYARRVMGHAVVPQGQGLTVIEKPYSGYYVIADGPTKMVIDCGEVGPPYQSGHAHCDTLSYELSVNGQRLVVDSGVYDYEPGLNRQYARSTAAHNSVLIDHAEQSQMWGGFRVAKRARPLYARACRVSERRATFTGAHDGYRRLAGKPVHERSIDYHNRVWMINDRVVGQGRHTMISYVHLDPKFIATLSGRRIDVHDGQGARRALIEVEGEGEVSLQASRYFPEFGKESSNTAVVFTVSGDAPMTMAYSIRADCSEIG